MPLLTLPGHTEYPASGEAAFVWPGTQGSGLSCNPGDLILRNRGSSLTYTSEDGFTTLTFGAYLNEGGDASATATISGGAVTGITGLVGGNGYSGGGDVYFIGGGGTGGYATTTVTSGVITGITGLIGGSGYTSIPKVVFSPYGLVGNGTGASPNPYDGPWASIAPTGFDIGDLGWEGSVEIWADVDYALDATAEEYAVVVRSGDPINLGANIAPNAVGVIHMHKGHVVNGHFSGGTLGCVAGTVFTAMAVTQGDKFYFVTSNGHGDADNGLGGDYGDYMISEGGVFAVYNGMALASNPPYIGSAGGACTAQWPSTGQAASMIAWCHVHPGGSSTVLSTPTGGSSALAGSSQHSIRYAYQKTLTVETVSAGVSNVSGQAQWQQLVETPLSSELLFTLPAGGPYSVTFTVPNPPAILAGWSTVLYTQSPVGSGSWQRLTSGTNYTMSGNTVTLFNDTTIVPTTSYQATHGFSAWPSGTLLVKDPNVAHLFMKIGHLSKVVDGTGNYTFLSYQVNAGSAGSRHLPPKIVEAGNLLNTGSGTTGQVPTLNSDGKSFTWQTISPASGMTNPMNAQYDMIYGGTVTSGVAAPVALAPPTRAGILVDQGNAAPTWSLPPTSTTYGVPAYNGASMAWVQVSSGVPSVLCYTGSVFNFQKLTAAMMSSGTNIANSQLMADGSGNLVYSPGVTGSTGEAFVYNGSSVVWGQISNAMLQSGSVHMAQLQPGTSSQTFGQILQVDSLGTSLVWGRITVPNSINGSGGQGSFIQSDGAGNANWLAAPVSANALVSNGTNVLWGQISNAMLQSGSVHMAQLQPGTSSQTYGQVLQVDSSGTNLIWGKITAANSINGGGAGTVLLANGSGATWEVIVDSGDAFGNTSTTINGTHTVFFNRSFPGTPIVTLTAGGAWGSGTLVYVNGVSSSGFTANVQYNTQVSANNLWWTAVYPNNLW